MGTRLPALGPRGEGWVAAQLVLLAGVVAAPFASGRGLAGPVTDAIGAVFLAGGLLLATAAGVRLGGALTPYPVPRGGHAVASSGAYARVRHPIYGGVLLAAAGWTLLLPSWAGLGTTVALAVLFDLKSRREEAWLVERLPGYEAYRQRTPRRLLPWLY